MKCPDNVCSDCISVLYDILHIKHLRKEQIEMLWCPQCKGDTDE